VEQLSGLTINANAQVVQPIHKEPVAIAVVQQPVSVVQVKFHLHLIPAFVQALQLLAPEIPANVQTTIFQHILQQDVVQRQRIHVH